MMRPSHLVLAAAALLALAAREPRASTEPTTPPSADDLLGAIDFAPQRSDLDAAMTSALDELVARASDDLEDAGIRLHAIRALARYPSPEAKDALLALIANLEAARAGVDLLLLRAALEALAEVGGPDEVPVIAQFLDAEGTTSQQALDLRATAAKALGVIASPTAVQPLRARQSVEQSEEVRFAITEALRAILGS